MRYGIMEGDHGEDLALLPREQRRGLVADQIAGLVNQAEALVQAHVAGQGNNQQPEPEPMEVDEIIEEVVHEQVDAVIQAEGLVQGQVREPNLVPRIERITPDYARALEEYNQFFEDLANSSSSIDPPEQEESSHDREGPNPEKHSSPIKPPVQEERNPDREMEEETSSAVKDKPAEVLENPSSPINSPEQEERSHAREELNPVMVYKPKLDLENPFLPVQSPEQEERSLERELADEPVQEEERNYIDEEMYLAFGKPAEKPKPSLEEKGREYIKEIENEFKAAFESKPVPPINGSAEDQSQLPSSSREARGFNEEQGSGQSPNDEDEEEGGDVLTKVVECATGPIISKAMAVVQAEVDAREARASSGEPEREIPTSEPIVINLPHTVRNYTDIVRQITYDRISFADYISFSRPEYVRDTYDNIEECFDDLFNADSSWALAHCVSSDMTMFRGIAVEFRRRFQSISFLKLQYTKPGYVAVLYHLTPEDRIGRFIFYLVTKQIFNQKPTYFNIYCSLVRMRNICEALNITKVAMPRIASGCDRMDFRLVKHYIHLAFLGSNIQVRVYTKIE